MSAFVKKYPALSMLIVSYTIGMGITAIVIAGILPPGFFLLAAVSGSLAGIILAAVESGKEGVGELLRRLLVWRVGLLPWMVALGLPFVFYFSTMVLYALFSGTQLSLRSLEPFSTFIPLLLFLTVQAGLGEELGWRGYLLPRLQARFNALTATLIVAVIWIGWHTPLFFIDGLMQNTMRLGIGFLTAYLLYGGITIGYSIVYTWLVNNSKGSVLMACIFHGSINAWAGYLAFDTTAVEAALYLAGVTLVVAILFVFFAGPEHLSKKFKRNVVGLEGEIPYKSGETVQLA